MPGPPSSARERMDRPAAFGHGMDSVTQAERCFRHPERPTGRHCTRCGRPACPDCLRQAAVGSHCVECIRAERGPVRERARVRLAFAGSELWATKALIGLNLAVFAVGLLSGGRITGAGVGEFAFDWGLFAPFVDEGDWWRMVTSGFLHAGLMHLGFNMVALAFLGRIVEPVLGPVRLTALYMASLLGGSLGALLVDPMALTVGASGAIFGLMGAAVVGMRRRGSGIMESGLGGLLLINLLITFVIPGISVGGHLGGLAAGAAVGAIALGPGAERRALPGLTAAAVVGVVCFAGGLWAAAQWADPLF